MWLSLQTNTYVLNRPRKYRVCYSSKCARSVILPVGEVGSLSFACSIPTLKGSASNIESPKLNAYAGTNAY